MTDSPAERRPYAPPPGTRRWRLTAQWDGAGFVGWQSQPGQRSVQDALQAALAGLFPALGGAARAVAAGRTDSGVHAEAMPLHWDLPEEIQLPPQRLARALNAHLPADLAVLEAGHAPPGFHARFSCVQRHYVYRLYAGGERRPLMSGRALHLPRPLDTAAMRAAAAELIGKHDFAAFATQEERQTIRTLTRLDVLEAGELTELPDGLTELHVSGESFLRHMVRGLVGTLLQVGRGELDAAGVAAVLAGRDRGRAGPNVPPHGLYFVGADYPPDGDSVDGSAAGSPSSTESC